MNPDFIYDTERDKIPFLNTSFSSLRFIPPARHITYYYYSCEKDRLAQPGTLRSSALSDIRGYWREEYCNDAFIRLIKLLYFTI
jgi:hypothetical protein